MRQTLLSRFQGTLLGAALGDIVVMTGSRSETPAWGKVMLEQLHRLIHSTSVAVPAASQTEPAASQTEIAIASLPLALFYHEDLTLLRQQTQQIAAQNAETSISAIVINHAIALAVQERLHPKHLVSQLLALPLAQAPLLQQLALVQVWQTAGAAPQNFVEDLCARSTESAPIALAFYAFLNTPEDFRLSLLRAAQLSCQSPYTCILTGALSGAYNGKAGLPLAWRKALRTVPENRSLLATLWQVKSEAELLTDAHRLLAAWAGMSNPTQRFQLDPSAIVAAPRFDRAGSRFTGYTFADVGCVKK